MKVISIFAWLALLSWWLAQHDSSRCNALPTLHFHLILYVSLMIPLSPDHPLVFHYSLPHSLPLPSSPSLLEPSEPSSLFSIWLPPGDEWAEIKLGLQFCRPPNGFFNSSTQTSNPCWVWCITIYTTLMNRNMQCTVSWSNPSLFCFIVDISFKTRFKCSQNICQGITREDKM